MQLNKKPKIKSEKLKIKLVFICVIYVSTVFGQNFDSTLFSNDLEEIPKVKLEWRDYAIENSVPIRSIESDDFSDLQFLSEILQEKKYVFLGESSHYVKEFNKLKYRLIRFLTTEME